MGLEEIEGIRADIRKLKEEREVNVKDALKSISNIKEKYNALLEEEGKEYCNTNCPDIPHDINKLQNEFTEYNT
jgi:F0F1-type ATP synthase membrane subunit b/b'